MTICTNTVKLSLVVIYTPKVAARNKIMTVKVCCILKHTFTIVNYDQKNLQYWHNATVVMSLYFYRQDYLALLGGKVSKWS